MIMQKVNFFELSLKSNLISHMTCSYLYCSRCKVSEKPFRPTRRSSGCVVSFKAGNIERETIVG